MNPKDLHHQNIIACIWDFDKTLIPGYMQEPLFKEYGIDDQEFWKEVNTLPGVYAKQGVHVSKETVYLNHLLSFIRNGALKGLNNSHLRELGAKIEFYPGLPNFFHEMKEAIASDPRYQAHDLKLEHYIISTGLAEMIRGSKIAPYVDGIFGCEFVENPMPPGYLQQSEFPLDGEREIGQIGNMVDNTIKTRYIFELNKGANKNTEIDVNSSVRDEDRRIPVKQMLYIADGPSDVPVFALLKKNGGRTYAVYNESRPDEFAQNDNLLQANRIHAYGPANYTPTSSTYMWIKMHLLQMCEQVVSRHEYARQNQIMEPPKHLHKPKLKAEDPNLTEKQPTFF